MNMTCSLCVIRALAAGCKTPLLVCPEHDRYPLAARVTALGALHAVYVVSSVSAVCILSCIFIDTAYGKGRIVAESIMH